MAEGFAFKHNIGQFRSMVRIVQSIMHTRIHDRYEADMLGHTISDFVLCNWGTVSQEFGDGASDELEIVERVARIVLRQLESS